MPLTGSSERQRFAELFTVRSFKHAANSAKAETLSDRGHRRVARGCRGHFRAYRSLLPHDLAALFNSLARNAGLATLSSALDH
jgi:hypothetical protein